MPLGEETTARTLLIVDDSKVSRMRIRAFFVAQCPHWTLVEAASGDEALTLAADAPPDFVTMDVNMPGMSGFETAQLMLMRNPDIRIVMLTGNIQESSRQVAASLRLNFVAKPVAQASLQQALDFAGARMTGLDELELDALTEIFNVGVGLAADALHQMLGEHIPLSVPQVELSSQRQAQAQFLARAQRDLCVVKQTYAGDFTTEALLVFADADSLKLVRMMVGVDLPPEELLALRQDALGEMGNIVLNAVISNLSTTLCLPLEGSIPVVSETSAAQLFGARADAGDGQDCQVLALMIDFALSSQNVQAHLVFLLDSASTQQLRQKLAQSFQ